MIFIPNVTFQLLWLPFRTQRSMYRFSAWKTLIWRDISWF